MPLKKKKSLLSVLLISVMLWLTACSATGEVDSDSPSEGKSGGGSRKTDVGTPRNETLIVDILSGRQADPKRINPYLPGAVAADAGLHQLVFSNLWEIDTVNGKQIPDLAATMPEPLDNSMKKFRFKVQEGLTWSDGKPFTAEDVEFTSNMILETPELPYSGYFKTLVKSMKAVDKYTVEVETVKPETRLAQKLGVVIFGNSFKVVPKHIWKNKDPTKFAFTDPIGVGPYVLKERDPQGYWFLYEKRKDWQKSDIGKLVGEPGPKYILFKYFGPEEKRIMASVQHNLDVLQDITPESWEVLQEKNEYAQAWYDSFPYANMDDPCERGMSFNVSKAPFDNRDVRWALTLATDIKSVSMATYGGMLRVSPIIIPPTEKLQNTYHKPMLDWLSNFELSDGYKPFDDNYARDMIVKLKQQGIEGLPSDAETMTDTFGVGWWKYDPDKAGELLNKNGFKKQGNKWLKPDGSPWKVTISAPADFEVQSMRLAFAVADSWRKFGIDVNVQQMDSATFWDTEATGNFDVGSYWPNCGLLPDLATELLDWHKQYVVPTGKQASGNRTRYKNDHVSKLVEELNALNSDDPSVIDKTMEITKIFVEEMPNIPMFGTSKFVPVDTYYWEGFQSAENAFEGPWWWWSQFKFYTPHIKPTGR